MTDPQQVAGDLAFIRHTVEQRKSSHFAPATIAILWAAIILGGCLINDFEGRYSWIYWGISPAFGFVASWIMGAHRALRIGEYDPARGIRCALHWGSLFLASFPLWFWGFSGKVDGQLMGQLLFLISGIYWFLSGIHLDRRMTIPGVAMMLSASAMQFLPHYQWTVSGCLVAVALVIGFAFTGTRDVQRS